MATPIAAHGARPAFAVTKKRDREALEQEFEGKSLLAALTDGDAWLLWESEDDDMSMRSLCYKHKIDCIEDSCTVEMTLQTACSNCSVQHKIAQASLKMLSL